MTSKNTNGLALRQAPETYRFPVTGQDVRVVVIDDELWFVASDVCAILGHTNTSVALRMLDDDEKRTVARSHSSDTLNFGAVLFGDARVQSRVLVSEPGLFNLILRSNVPGARPFKRWLTHEVLPAIRRTGSYTTQAAPTVPPLDTPEGVLALASHFHETAKQLVSAEARVAELEPGAEAWEALAEATGDYSLREAAFMLSRDPAISTGQNRLMRFLRDGGLVDRKGVPYVRYSRYLVERPVSYTHPHSGEPVLKSQVRITVDGLEYLRKRLGGIGREVL
jgi:anti-repressor protein